MNKYFLSHIKYFNINEFIRNLTEAIKDSDRWSLIKKIMMLDKLQPITLQNLTSSVQNQQHFVALSIPFYLWLKAVSTLIQKLTEQKSNS